VVCEPIVALLPDQAPEAVHEVASVDDQFRVALAPLAMVLGLKVIVTVGAAAAGGVVAAGVTLTVTDWAALPPAPTQFSE
jgi:uncharacterized protein (DUF697 family)